MIMNSTFMKKAGICFHVLCIISAITLMIWCGVEYSKNSDLSEVSYKPFMVDDNSVYPATTICIHNRFDESALKKYNQSFNASSYAQFIGGHMWDAEMAKVDYENVSLNISDYLIGACYRPDVGSFTTCINNVQIETYNYVYGRFITRCFSFHPQSTTRLMQVYIALKASIFPQGIRPTSYEFVMYFHYPQQFTRSTPSQIGAWPSRANTTSKYFEMEITSGGVEVLKRRQKDKGSCLDWKAYDTIVMNDIMNAIKCRPAYWNTKQYLPLCSKREQWKNIHDKYEAMREQSNAYGMIIPPCIELKKMQVTIRENDGEALEGDYWGQVRQELQDTLDDNEKWFGINVLWVTAIDFKQIKSVRAYNWQSLVGNAGGYVGLLVGYTVSQIPILLLAIYCSLKRMWLFVRNRVGAETATNQDNTDANEHETEAIRIIANEIQRIHERLDKTVLHVDNKLSAFETCLNQHGSH